MVSLQNPWIRRIGLGVVGLGSALSLAQSVQANPGPRWFHLDVHRHCRTAIRAGAQHNGLQFTSDGWHHYAGGQQHRCGVMAQQIMTATQGSDQNRSGGGGINLTLLTIQGQSSRGTNESRSYTTLGPNQRHNLEVWYQPACRNQGGNGNHIVSGPVVWCQR